MTKTKVDRVLQLVRERGILRSRDLSSSGVERVYLQRMCDQGLLERVALGLYSLPEADVTRDHALALAARHVPRGTVCLLSALQFHGLTTQSPHEVWMALPAHSRAPALAYPPLRVVYLSGRPLEEGADEHVIENVPVRVYGPAKTVADCFRFRNKIGLDVALEALRDCRRRYNTPISEFLHFADVCRVVTVMKPYLEVLE